MTIKELETVIMKLKEQGYSEEKIINSFTYMYLDGKLNFEQYDAVLAFMDYKLSDDILNASEGARKVILRKMIEN